MEIDNLETQMEFEKGERIWKGINKRLSLFILFLLVPFFLIPLKAKTGIDYARDLLGLTKYRKYGRFVKSIISPGDSLYTVVQKLKNNGLLEILEQPATIYPVFTFEDNSPKKDTFALYQVLHRIGYSFYYPRYINRDLNRYSLQMEIKAIQQIDPLRFIEEMHKRGCRVTDIKKYQNYMFIVRCGEIQIPEAYTLKQLAVGKGVQNPTGTYWIAVPQGVLPTIKVASPTGNRWHPYLAFYDGDLHLLDQKEVPVPQRQVIIQPPSGTRFIKIADMFTPTNIRRGFLIEAKYTMDRKFK